MSRFTAPTSPEITAREKEHQARVRAIAGDCMVLLENDGILPLNPEKKVIAFDIIPQSNQVVIGLMGLTLQ